MKSSLKPSITYTVTAALPYANGPIHIGHLAGVYVPADIYVRYLRAKQMRVLFVCGSDEHGVPITIRAQQEGTTPQEVVDRYHVLNKKAFEDFGISFDVYDRTSSPRHYETAAAFFTTLHDKALLEVYEEEQFYDPVSQQFLADRYLKGQCPQCGFGEAYGDQCEACGSTLNPLELINPKSMLSGAEPERRLTKHWYLPLNHYETWLREWILEGHKEDWKSNVYGQCKSWIEQGLQPRAVTRDLPWGVPVPLSEAKDKVLYVWFDAPIGYISATQTWAEAHGARWEDYWQGPDVQLIHFIGKDNIVFHCIIFPVMLKAHGEYVLPTNVPANEFMNLEGRKISTSRNWAVWLPEYLEQHPHKQDILRYVLCANTPETKDSDFTWQDFQDRNNNELVAIVGNFIHRSLVLSHKYFGGKVPAQGSLQEIDQRVEAQLKELPGRIGVAIEQFKFREALSLWLELARLGNKYLADTEPWKLKDEDRIQTILYVALQVAAHIAVLGNPFIPFTTEKLQHMLHLPDYTWDDTGNLHLLPSGTVLGQPTLLFEKIDLIESAPLT